jgi:hypothetical protein
LQALFYFSFTISGGMRYPSHKQWFAGDPRPHRFHDFGLFSSIEGIAVAFGLGP